MILCNFYFLNIYIKILFFLCLLTKESGILYKKVPKGKITTYKEIAITLKTKDYRTVGNALNKNPYAPIVSYHRVVNSNGLVGSFAHGIKTKKKLLEKEGIKTKNYKVINFEKVLFKFKPQVKYNQFFHPSLQNLKHQML